MPSKKTYVLDANVFIEAKRRYYAFAICPGFWNSILGHCETGDLHSIDYIKQELVRGKDDLAEWVTDKAPDELFKSSQESDVIQNYEQIMLWVNRSRQFYEPAKAKFAASADGWLLAYAQAKSFVVVTHEEFAPDAKNKVPMPNICERFDIQYKDTFFMLSALGVQFEWKT